jgi:hypothetical protein
MTALVTGVVILRFTVSVIFLCPSMAVAFLLCDAGLPAGTAERRNFRAYTAADKPDI